MLDAAAKEYERVTQTGIGALALPACPTVVLTGYCVLAEEFAAGCAALAFMANAIASLHF